MFSHSFVDSITKELLLLVVVSSCTTASYLGEKSKRAGNGNEFSPFVLSLMKMVGTLVIVFMTVPS